MKAICIIALTFFIGSAHAQNSSKNIFNTWVTSQVTYPNGASLPDTHPLKYLYIKYKFSQPDHLNIGTAYFENGSDQLFELNSNVLTIKSPEGGYVNSYRIEALKDTLVLLQAGLTGFDDADALKFYFVPETTFQNSIPLSADDIISIKGKDTIYKQSRKIYASYNGNSFQQIMYNGIRKGISMNNRAGSLSASFIVSKTGLADSVRILEGIDDKFNSLFVKVFNQQRKNWKPAILQGQPVSVKMLVNLGYSTSATAIPAVFDAQKANDAYNSSDYELALFYFDKALVNTPNDKDNLCKRGLCKLMLGNKDGACLDWNKVRSLGSTPVVDELLKKYCL
nr:hypothetical protein [uncultured Mucilaginibacter sp.]